MPSFRDKQQQLWQYELDVPAARRVYRLLGIDLIAEPIDSLLARLASPCFIIDLLYCLCQPECEARGVSDEDFGRGLVVDLDPIVTDLVEAHADFFQTLGKAQKARLIRSAIGKARTLTEKAAASGARIEQQLDRLLEDHYSRLERNLDRMISDDASGAKSIAPELSPASGPISPALRGAS